ncbi:hypothetical protein MMC16_001187 [Acarospora aff. strigata]|nr:hypothetical protein [Acarospora aff. strigata]
MSPKDIITIPSDDEDDDVQIISVTRRRRRKRRKTSHCTLEQAELRFNNQYHREAPSTFIGSASAERHSARARSADVQQSKSVAEPIAERARSAPQDTTNTGDRSASFHATLLAKWLPRHHSRLSTPPDQTISHMGSLASSNARQAYPTPETASSPVHCQYFVHVLPSSSVAPERCNASIGVGRRFSDSGEEVTRGPPTIIAACHLSNPFRGAAGSKGDGPFFAQGSEGGKISGGSLDKQGTSNQANLSPAKAVDNLMPQTAVATGTQQAGRGSSKATTTEVVNVSSGDINDNSIGLNDRTREPFPVPPMTLQPPVRNHILWSTPPFRPTIDDHNGLPLPHVARPTKCNTASIPLASADSQSPRRRRSQKTWTCKMYADLAQQLQECFSFAEFAEKYSRSEHEVFELFSAVVQLPLLQRSSTGLSKVSPPSRRNVEIYKTLMKETRSVLAQQELKEGDRLVEIDAAHKRTVRSRRLGLARAKASSKAHLDVAIRPKSPLAGH